MTPQNISLGRLHTHHLLDPKFPTAADAVSFFGAVQAQDYLASLWALGLRTRDATEATIEQAIADRAIIRTWPLRGTIHFVTAADARWMLELSAPRALTGNAARLRELELDDAVFAQSRSVLAGVLNDGRPHTRRALLEALDAAGISTAGQRGIHILGRLAQEGLICIGPRVGKQQAFVLLDAWLPPSQKLARDEAVAELTRRYFNSHGPATVQDYTWWSGLAPAEARAGLEAVNGELSREEIDGRTVWFTPSPAPPQAVSPIVHLLPVYDEYVVAYKDRSAVLAPEYAARPDAGNGIFRAPILIDGQIAGTWTRKLKMKAVIISPNLFRGLTGDEERALLAAAKRYGAFLRLSAELAQVS
ncbi:MAG: AlkZ family DNA glycosylase [Candidatus Promineofilum sp.]|nr:AlkZ family DNA glycosylase [Promineifilum sp.]